MTLNYVTKNEYKVFMTKLFMQRHNIEVNQIKMYVPEIQETSVKEVADFSSKYAYEKLQIPVLKNDGGLYIPALNDFPAAYTAFCESALGEDGILKLMQGKENRYAYWLEALAYTDETGTKVFMCKTEGEIALEKSGNFGWGYDRIFIVKGQNKTLANFNDTDRGMLWNQDGYDQLAEYIKARNIDKQDKV